MCEATLGEWARRLVIVLAAACVGALACSSSSGSVEDGDAGAAGAAGSVPLTLDPVVCGGVECAELGAEELNAKVRLCCTDDDRCGTKLRFVDECYAERELGGVDPTCDTHTVFNVVFPGCCAADGRCGVLDLTNTVGCIKGELVEGYDARECVFEPDNDCTEIQEVPCDGAEDCPGDQVCCGDFTGSAYVGFHCQDSCDPQDQRRLCGVGDTCDVDGYECGDTIYLPDFLNECDSQVSGPPVGDPGPGIRCGTTEVCAVGMKCCLRKPHGPICVPEDVPCSCKPGSG